MSTTSTVNTAAGDDPERPEYKVTGLRVLRAEWAKFWSLRSTWITLGLALVFCWSLRPDQPRLTTSRPWTGSGRPWTLTGGRRQRGRPRRCSA
jgi:hypothetical protein